MGDTFKLIIGAEKKEVMVHKEYLIRTSDFFKACCDGHDWKESMTKTVELPDEDVERFQDYLHWLYTSELFGTEGVEAEIGTPRPENGQERRDLSHQFYGIYERLAVLADQFGDQVFENAVVDKIIEAKQVFKVSPASRIVREVYAALPESSSLRKLLVDSYRDSVTLDYIQTQKQTLPQDFIFDLMLSFAQDRKETKRVTRGNRCNYHVHNDKIPKCD